MINYVDQALERHLRRSVPLAESDVDVAFDAPDRTWSGGLTRPAVNVFLWQVGRSPHQHTGLEQRLSDAGAIERRRTQPVVDLNYLITAWAAELRDEHQLLGTILECILAHDVLPAEVLPPRLDTATCRIGLASRDGIPSEFWSSLDGRLKPGIQITVSLPVEVFAWIPTAPVVEELGARVGALRAREVAAADGLPVVTRRRGAGGAVVVEGRRSAGGRSPGSGTPGAG